MENLTLCDICFEHIKDTFYYGLFGDFKLVIDKSTGTLTQPSCVNRVENGLEIGGLWKSRKRWWNTTKKAGAGIQAPAFYMKSSFKTTTV
jgi:hypothetical protein